MVNQWQRKLSEKEVIDGFIVDSSQTIIVQWILERYPETAVHVKSQDLEVRTSYMNVFLDIFGTLSYRKSCDISDDELGKVSEGLSDLKEAGFKVEWLRAKFDDVSLNARKTRIVKLKEEVKKLERIMFGLIHVLEKL